MPSLGHTGGRLLDGLSCRNTRWVSFLPGHLPASFVLHLREAPPGGKRAPWADSVADTCSAFSEGEHG